MSMQRLGAFFVGFKELSRGDQRGAGHVEVAGRFLRHRSAVHAAR